MTWFQELKLRAKESLSWLSVQVTAAWGLVWFLYSQLPPNNLQELSKVQFHIWVLTFNVVGLMGLAQAVTTYMARMKKGKSTE